MVIFFSPTFKKLHFNTRDHIVDNILYIKFTITRFWVPKNSFMQFLFEIFKNIKKS